MENNRREFIKKACGICAAVVGLGAALPALQSCSTFATVRTNASSGTIVVPKSMFTDESKLVIIKNEAAAFDMVLVDLGNNVYKAMELQCTHQENPLIPTKNGFFCNAHGSAYTLEGKVKQEPALTDMKSFLVSIENENIIITL